MLTFQCMSYLHLQFDETSVFIPFTAQVNESSDLGDGSAAINDEETD